MRSRSSARTTAYVCVGALVGLPMSTVPVVQTSAAEAVEHPGSTVIREPQIDAALEKLRADPDLATTREVRTLRWIDDNDKKRERPGWYNWIRQMFRWIAEGSRYLVWTIIAIFLALLLLYFLRFLRTFDRKATSAADKPPTHVRDLDIRPESLPDDIGAAAWTLWERGEHRSALSLLYRGLLSRLVHEHTVPIRDSSTEGDCLALAERHLPADRRGYIAQLIRTWQRAVYGGEDPQNPEMRALCDRFDEALRPAAPPQEAVQ